MTLAQRCVLLAGSIGILHTSMVPPVQQIGAAAVYLLLGLLKSRALS